jgi:hypothetical protein
MPNKTSWLFLSIWAVWLIPLEGHGKSIRTADWPMDRRTEEPVLIDHTIARQGMELLFDVVLKIGHRIVTDAKINVEYGDASYRLSPAGDHYTARVYANRLGNRQPYSIHAHCADGKITQQSTLDVDWQELVLQYDSDLDSAAHIAFRDLNLAKTVKCGCLTVQPQAIGGSYDGVWLTDSGEAYEAIRYWADNAYVKDYLYSTDENRKGLIDFFAQYQERDGENAGNLSEAIYGDAKHHWDKDRTIDFGGAFDLSVKPRRNFRDLGNSVYLFCNYWYWKDFDEVDFIGKYYDVMKKFLDYHLTRKDAPTGLITSTYMIDHCDVCIDQAVAGSCAVFTVNALLCTAMEQFSQMADAVGKKQDSKRYHQLADALKRAINRTMWNDKNNRYEIKILRPVTENSASPAFAITEDHYFFPASHGRFLDDWGNFGWIIPENRERTARIINSIEEAQQGIKIYAPMVFPAYPDGWHNKILNGGKYCNGDCWPQFGLRYLAALFRQGYPDIAMHGLNNMAAVVQRDNCFYEYYENDGEGKGKGVGKNNWANARYLHALVKGLFGLQADYPNHKVYIHPSLEHSGKIKCRLGMHGFEVRYSDQGAESKTLQVLTTYKGPVDFRLLLPASTQTCLVSRDGKKAIHCRIVTLGQNRYVVFKDSVHSGCNNYTLNLQ